MWEPTDEDVAAYWDGVTAARTRSPNAPLSSSALISAGLQAAYAKLEERLFRGEPMLLGPPMQVGRIPPPLMEYDEVGYLEAVNEHACDGWRIRLVYGPRDAPRYVLERERPEPE